MMERIAIIFNNIVLFLLEYFLKVSSGIAGLIVLGADGSFFTKLVTGYHSLLPVIGEIIKFPERMTYTWTVVDDYNTLTAASFNQRYGAQAVNHVMVSMNDGVAYFQSVYQNLAFQPIGTVFAFLVAFLSLYLLGRGICFIRQKGQGSYLAQMERKMGNRVFNIR
ncbi:MAG: hypothetical protein WD267_09135 [Balneolales bacterium]